MNFWEPLPLFRLAICLALGLAWGAGGWDVTPLLCWVAGLWWFVHFGVSLRRRSTPVFMVFLLLGAWLGWQIEQPKPVSPSGNVTISGLLRIEDDPAETRSGLRFEASVSTLQDTVPFKVMVYSSQPATNIEAGQIRPVLAKLYPLPAKRSPEDFDYGGWLLNRGIVARLYLDSIGPALGADPGWRYKLLKFRKKALSNLPVELSTADLLAALILGDKSGLDPETKASFRDAGVMHLLAVSGLHVGLVMLLCKGFFGLFRLRSVRITGELLSIGIVWLYAILCGAGPSVCRAATMLSLLSFGNLLGKNGQGLNILGLSALILLTLNPSDLFDSGFQLSYLAVCGIMLFPNSSFLKGSIINDLINGCGVSLTAQLWTSPVTLKLFGGFPLYFLLGNLLLLPLATLVLYLGIALMIFSLAGWKVLATVIAFPLDGLVHLLVGLSGLISDLPFSILPVRIASALMTSVCLTVIFFTFVSLKRRRITGLCAGIPVLIFFMLIHLALPRVHEGWVIGRREETPDKTLDIRGYSVSGINCVEMSAPIEAAGRPVLDPDVLIIHTSRKGPLSDDALSLFRPELIVLLPGSGSRQRADWVAKAGAESIPIFGKMNGYTKLRAWRHMPYLCEDEYSDETDRMSP